MDNRHIIAGAISDNELARAFSELVADRWDNWDLSPYLTYLVDICAPDVLPYLAEQFDVDGLQGLSTVANEQQQRDLIKRSIALHKYVGTPWAIREACRTVGFPVIILEEGVTAIPGGAVSADDWARFRVLVDSDNAKYITAELSQKVRMFVEFYKNERSHLVDFGFFQSMSDDVEVLDRIGITTLIINPNPAVLNPAGELVKTHVSINVPWIIEDTQYEWNDGSGDCFSLSYTGVPGKSEIEIISDHNYAGLRELEVDIKSLTGYVLGTLTVRQRLNWNAYSRAYSKAYNTFTYNAYGIGYGDGYGDPELISNN